MQACSRWRPRRQRYTQRGAAKRSSLFSFVLSSAVSMSSNQNRPYFSALHPILACGWRVNQSPINAVESLRTEINICYHLYLNAFKQCLRGTPCWIHACRQLVNRCTANLSKAAWLQNHVKRYLSTRISFFFFHHRTDYGFSWFRIPHVNFIV